MRPEDLLARLEAGYEYDPMYGQLCNERDKLKAENAKLRALLIDAFVEFVQPYGNADDVYEYSSRMHEVGVKV